MHCRALLRAGSASFHTASRALPSRLVHPVTVLYAFCRVSDDAIDESDDPVAALALLRARVDAIVAGEARADPVDRAMSWLLDTYALPRAPLDALLEGYAWDAEGRRYETYAELLGYCARVASSVGVLMSHLCGVREPAVLARAIDLGAALQLVNVARDVGEDARRGRVYLPGEWLRAGGLEPEALLARPEPLRAVRHATLRLLDRADILAARAMLGVPYLPRDTRLAVRAAARIYLDIGRLVREQGGDGVSARARTSAGRKAVLLVAAAIEERQAHRRPIVDPVLPEAAFLLASP